MTFTNGMVPGFQMGMQDIQDSDSGQIGLALSVSYGGMGDASYSAYRVKETFLPDQPITLQGLPSSHVFAGASRCSRNGTLIGRAYTYAQGAYHHYGISIDASNSVTFLGEDAQPVAINDAGVIVGGIYHSAWLWRNGIPTLLGDGDGAVASAINNHGHIAVYRSYDGCAIWANGQIVRIVDLVGPNADWVGFSVAIALNDHGWLVCQAGHRDLNTHYALIKLGPRVSQQPTPRMKVPGQSVAFATHSYGVGEMCYQWRKNGKNLLDGGTISGATTPSLTIRAIELSDAAAYDLVVQDSYGRTTSSNAALTVVAEGCLPPPAGLVTQWTGDNTEQEVLNRSNVRLMNGAHFGTGIVDGAFVLDGVDDYVATDVDLQPQTMPNCTLEAWIYPTRLFFQSDQIIFNRDGGEANPDLS